MAKKSQEPDKSPDEAALEEHVDEMMSVDKHETDVSKLAEDFNKQALASRPLTPANETKSTAPELPEAAQAESTEPPTSNEADNSESQTELAPVPDQTLDDQKTDEAVDEIVAEEGDTVLAVEDARRKKLTGAAKPPSDWKAKLKSFFKNKWTWAGIAVILIALFAVPVTRYKVLGLFIKKTVVITVIDSKTSSPVSEARIQLAGVSAKTDESGEAKLKTGVGSHKITVTKKYYTDYKGNYFVGFSKQANSQIRFVATGRLVPVKVINKITGKPVSGVKVEAQGTTAKTNSQGQAQIALPVKADSYQAKLSFTGFNETNVTIKVIDKLVTQNTFGLVPSGQVYFLSNLNGTIDVVKSNLDGSGRKVVLEGTGNEQQSTTGLLASRDWHYLVLKARRDTPKPALYLINTDNDKVTPFDNSDSEFNLIGWYAHSFMYSLDKNNLAAWQPGKQIIKSYDADHQQLNQLDQNLAEGAQSSYAYQNLSNFYILNGVLSYTVEWVNISGDLNGKNDSIRAIQPNGQGKKDYQNFAAATTGYIQAALYAPQAVYYSVYDTTANKNNYFEFENLSVKSASIDQTSFDQGYPTYLFSPSGSKTFWTELRDGKNALFIGDSNAGGKKQIASLSDYAPYGWYSDNYVLVSKNNSELYIMSPVGSKETPLKITDYYKPAQTYRGYGYGYGGL